jgi:hypothetical protein
MFLNGRNMTKKEILKRCGNINQLMGIKKYTFSEGKAKGVEAVDVNNGSGLRFTVLLDRNMDIAWCDYKGINISYMTSNSVVSPFYYDRRGNNWLRSFTGGLLTTCGIINAGKACIDKGEELGLHGNIGNCPVENVCTESYWEEDEFIIKLSGISRETSFFGENLALKREIKVLGGVNKIYIQDTIENLGTKESPLMMIYHFNFGYPILDKGCKVYIDSESSIGTSEEALRNIKDQYNIFDPIKNNQENVYFHVMNKENEEGKAILMNKSLGSNGLGVSIKFNLDELPYLNQWKMLGEGEYVLGLEPSNCMTLGRDLERERGTLRYIAPGENRTFNLELSILD